MLKVIGNILWFIFTGFISAIEYIVLGLGWCVTIVGIPFGIQAFKFAGLVMWPFGKTIQKDKGHPIANFLWFVLGGFVVCLSHVFLGVFWCITIVGIPFGKQCFKLAKLATAPFGRTAVKVKK